MNLACYVLVFKRKNSLNLLCCNVSSLINVNRRRSFVNHFLYPKGSSPVPNIIALQETGSNLQDASDWERTFRSKIIYSHPQPGSTLGVLIGVKDNIPHKFHNYNTDDKGRFIVADMEVQEERFTMVNLHIDRRLTKEDTLTFLNKIGKAIVEFNNERVLWCGDFNTILDPLLDTTCSGTTLDTRVRKENYIKKELEAWELTDVWRAYHPDKRRFTHISRTHKSLSRIDHFMASPSFLTYTLECEIGVAFQSDHAPIYLEFSFEEQLKGRGFWRLPQYLVNDKEFRTRVVEEIKMIRECNKEASPSLLWDTVKSSIRGVAIKYMSELKRTRKKNIERIELELVSNVQSRDATVDPDRIIEYDNKVKYLQVELSAQVESSNKICKEYNTARKFYFSERSSKYFLRPHLCHRNHIKILVNGKGEELVTTDEILTECHKFYSGLYRKPAHQDADNTGLLGKFLNQVPGDRINVSHYNLLSKDFSKQEFFESLKRMKKESAPGEDGFPVPFYLSFWDIIGDLVTESLLFAWSVGKMSITQRRGIIRLIPKVGKNLKNVASWRPISILNVDLKILSKSLSLRLSEVLPELVHPDQKGFVKGRFSGENVVDVYSMIQMAKDNEEEYTLLMLDIEKAFDSVSWSFLQEVLWAYNFPPSFISWIQILYKDKELRIVNNGHSSESITPLRGTAQGCSLSPLLYVLVMETMALNIRNNAKIEGFHIGDYHKKLAMLADDTLLALKASKISFEHALETLKQFAIISNLSVNASKSLIIPLNVSNSTKQDLCNMSSFTWLQEKHFNYLGVDVSLQSEMGTNSLGYLVPRIQQRLIERDDSKCSILGRILLVKSLIASMLIYPLSLIQSPPTADLKYIQKMCNDFVWSHGTHYIKRELMYLNIDQGGFNMFSIAAQEFSLKLSWVVRLLQPEHQFWKIHLLSQFKFSLQTILRANCSHVNFYKFLKQGCKLHPFWASIFKIWCQCNFTTTPYQGALVVGNSIFKSNKQYSVKFCESLPNQEKTTIQEWKASAAWRLVKPHSAFYKINWIREHLPEKSGVTTTILTLPLSTRAIAAQLL